jgi:hypothetical protein
MTRNTLRTFALALLLGSASCLQPWTVIIEGTVSEYRNRDSVFVSLTSNWESIQLAPDRFTIDAKGQFTLQFKVWGAPPPVTFIKNNHEYARLSVRGLRDPSPYVYDETNGTTYELRIDSKKTARVKVKL